MRFPAPVRAATLAHPAAARRASRWPAARDRVRGRAGRDRAVVADLRWAVRVDPGGARRLALAGNGRGRGSVPDADRATGLAARWPAAGGRLPCGDGRAQERAVVDNLAADHQAMNQSFDRLALVNTYGAFGSVGMERYELVIEGRNHPGSGTRRRPHTIRRPGRARGGR